MAEVKFENNEPYVELYPKKKSLVEKIKEKRENPYDRVFCVIDRDTHDDFDDALERVARFPSKTTRLETIVSDPCFEYWLLLHFVYTTMQFGAGEKSPCKDLISKQLSNYIPGYEKSDHQTISALVNHHQLNQAVKSAKRAMESAEREGRVSPITQMHLLVTYLKNLKEVS